MLISIATMNQSTLQPPVASLMPIVIQWRLGAKRPQSSRRLAGVCDFKFLAGLVQEWASLAGRYLRLLVRRTCTYMYINIVQHPIRSLGDIWSIAIVIACQIEVLRYLAAAKHFEHSASRQLHSKFWFTPKTHVRPCKIKF